MKALRTLKDLSYDPIEIKVREATNNDPIGASSTLMADIAQATHNYRLYSKLYAMLWKRLCDLEHILHVQKALILVEYLLRNGHDRFLNDCKKNARDIVRLTKYKYYNKDHEDIAHDVRFKAAIVTDLLNNTEKLSSERKKAEGMRGIRLQAQSHEDVHHKSVESQWSSIDKEKQEKAAAEQKTAAAKLAAQKKAAAAAKAAKQPEAEPEPEPEPADDDDEPAGPAGTVDIEDDPFGNPAPDPEPAAKPAAAAKKPAAKKPVAKPAPAPAAAAEDDGDADGEGPRRPSGAGDDPEFGAAIHAEHAAPAQPKAKSSAAPAHHASAPAKPAKPVMEDPFNVFDVGMTANKSSAATGPAVGGDGVDLLTSSFGAASVQADGGFVDVPAKKPSNPSPTPVRGASNVEAPAKPAGGANNELWGLDGLVSVDDLTGARKKDDKKAGGGGGGVSMGEMNQLKQGLGNGDLLAGFGGAPAPAPAGARASASGGANFALNNNPFFAPAPQPSPFQGLTTGGGGGGAPKPKPAAAPAGSNPFADLGFG